MIEWYKDKELQILFSTKPRLIMRYALPDDSKKDKVRKNKYPFMNIQELQVGIKYKDKYYSFTIPKNYTYDGATIPRIFWRIIGSKTQPEFLIPSLIHDYMCENHDCVGNDRNLSSKIFKALLLESGVGKIKANTMYFFVDNYQKLLKW